MKYMGSKARHAKEILKVIAPYRKEGQAWVEPFVGGANMIDKVEAPLRIGGDFNEYVIQALQYIQTSAESIPRDSAEYTESDYLKAKTLENISGLDCLMLFACSFGAKFKGGWARGRPAEDFVRAARNNALSQAPLIRDVMFFNASYDELPCPDGSLIYCDPPYAGTTKYRDAFDHGKFWQWCRDKSDEGHTVFVSEYNSPADFVPIWEKTTCVGVDAGARKATEKLFVYIPQLLRDGVRRA